MDSKENLNLLTTLSISSRNQVAKLESISFSLKIVILVLACLLALKIGVVEVIAIIGVALAIIAEIVGHLMHRARGLNEQYLRLRERFDLLGPFKLSKIQYADAVALENKKENLEGLNFWSKSQPGGRRICEGVIESAWWKGEMAKKCRAFLVILVVMVFIVGISLLEASKNSPDKSEYYIGFVIIALLTMLKVLWSILSFHALFIACRRIAGDGLALLEDPAEKGVNFIENALVILTDYQIARCSTIRVPSLIWKIYRKKLNEKWLVIAGKIEGI